VIATSPTSPILGQLQARDFRNLEPLDWRPGRGRHLLLGDNGAGKTSVLEAVYVLATTKSFRTSQLAECVRHEASRFELMGEVEGERRVRLAMSWSGTEKRRSVNGKEARLAEHLAVLPAVAWSAEEVEVLSGPPTLRRRLVDRGWVRIRASGLEVLSRYRQTLTQKRRLLGAEKPDLTPWNDLLAGAAAEIVAARHAYVEELERELGEVMDQVDLPFPQVQLRYRPSPRGALEGEEAIRRSLERVASAEIRKGIPLVGPHRDDMEILWGGRPVRGVASAGERRSLSLLLAAAQCRWLTRQGLRPLLLLDDLDAELAPRTLQRIWPILADADQLFASSNRGEVWEGLEVEARWGLSEGRMKSL
jgi:DNA replication and repair protein RecF